MFETKAFGNHRNNLTRDLEPTLHGPYLNEVGAKPHQPTLDLLFERTLRSDPVSFFLHCSDQDTPFMYSINDLYLYFPPPLVVRFFLPILPSISNRRQVGPAIRTILLTLVLTTAPFGDLHSVRELYRSVAQQNGITSDHDIEFKLGLSCESLEWLNIPTGFGSALAHSTGLLSFTQFTFNAPPHFVEQLSKLMVIERSTTNLFAFSVRKLHPTTHQFQPAVMDKSGRQEK
ncbi:hypothetical protein BLNAU_9576 [Blattamonas nauphoetae]|uniref:Uncharacterized protein n=1 Tax=Blattamonas nauphoetae TaxID=2049346 RepID=A0ABQ9XVM1_9EUKA|nr:hypothetical protein BLNAU_9576 [Blattamonas nauphoetae]